MFTGIIESMAEIKEKTANQLITERPAKFDDIKIGSSICVSGVCLSVVNMNNNSLAFDVMPETWDCTKLNSLNSGDIVNLERAMKYGDRFDGHIVQGHVEGVGKVNDRYQKEKKFETIIIEVPNSFMNSIQYKSSIAIDGVSLTVSLIQDNKINISLIPSTIKNTTLGSLKKEDQVNIETNLILLSNNLISKI